MARRKGSGRGKSTVNSRKSALENAREKLRDDPGGTANKQTKHDTMEDATTVAETATTKQYKISTTAIGKHKTKLTNATRVNEKRAATATSTATKNNHKQQQQTYRSTAETTTATTTTTAKQTQSAKQQTQTQNKVTAKATTKSATATTVGHIKHNKKVRHHDEEVRQEDNDEQPISQAVKKITITTEVASSSKLEAIKTSNKKSNNNSDSSISKNNAISISDKSKSLTTTTEAATKTTTTTKTNTSATGAATKILNNSNMTLQHVAESTASTVNASNTASTEILNDTTNNVATGTATEAATATATAATADIGFWNISKYLHKKFKRLASTTEVADVAGNTETTTATPIQQQQTQQQHQQQQTQQPQPQPQHQQQQQQRTTSQSSASTISSPPLLPTQQSATYANSNGHAADELFSANNCIRQQQQQQPQTYEQTTYAENAMQHIMLPTTNESNNNNNNNNSNKNINSINVSRTGIPYTNTTNSNAIVAAVNYAAHATLSPATFAQHQQQTQPTLQHTIANNNNNNINNNNEKLATTVGVSTAGTATATAPGGGRHVCPYCNMQCTKPSVLQKHIRAHTNERPYPCDTCGIAFKTRSNYYKHCRSRSHAARKRGLELPLDADDAYYGGSDQEVDAELSNSSTELTSRTASPLDDGSNSSLAFQMQHQHQQQQQMRTISPTPTTSPTITSFVSTKPTYLQQPAHYSTQQQHQLPLGSPAAGTLPPITVNINNLNGSSSNLTSTNNNITISNLQQQQQRPPSIEYKPYKPKFHNAALYAPNTAGKDVNLNLKQQQNVVHEQQEHQQKLSMPTNSAHLQQQQHITQPPSQPQPQQQQHPTLSPSTQLKLNNHINSHQLQLQMQAAAAAAAQHQQHQQHQHQQQAQALLMPANPSAAAFAAAAAAGVFYLGPQATPAVLHPDAYLPAQHFYSPAATAAMSVHQQALAAYNIMTPQQQQQLQQQYQQYQLQQKQQQQQQQHSPLMKTTILPVAPPTAAMVQPTAIPLTNTQLQRLAPPTQPPIVATPTAAAGVGAASASNQNTALHYLANAAISSAPPVSATTVMSTPAANLSTFATTTGGMQVNVEKVQEHISKLISQNEAIVENKEILLQKKYPKQSNRSRVLTNANNNQTTNSNSGNSNSNISGGGGGSNNQAVASGMHSNNTAPPRNESDTNVKLAQAIVQKQQQQQNFKMQQQLLLQQPHLRLDDVPATATPLNGISKRSAAATVTKAYNTNMKQQSLPLPKQPQAQPQYGRNTEHHIMHQIQSQSQSQLQPLALTTTIVPNQHAAELHSTTSTANNLNMPLNLSAKTKPPPTQIHTPAPMPTTPITTNTSARKKSNLEHPNPSVTPTNVTSTAGNVGSTVAAKNSIIKNLLLNARGLAVPTGEGDDAVYSCPICASEFRTAEELKHHNSTYCQDPSASAPISPVSSPSTKYFRSNSISLSLPELKNQLANSKNPLSLAKLAWSQLKTKPSSLVLSRLSASQSPAHSTSSNSSSVNATAAAAATASQVNQASSSHNSNNVNNIGNITPISTDVNALRFVDAPLPSPGPLLGKTPLVDFNQQSVSRKSSEDVVITKMHEERQFANEQHPAAKRIKYDNAAELYVLAPAPGTMAVFNNNQSGGDMQPLSITANNELMLSKKEERLRRFASSGGSMIPISECTDLDRSPKMIRTPLLSGGSFQEVSPKPKDSKERKSAELMATLTPKLPPTPASGFEAYNSGAHHFQFPPINSITGYNPLTLPPISAAVANEKVIPYVPGMPGPNSLTPQLPLPPPPQQLQLPPPARGRNVSPQRKVPSPHMQLQEKNLTTNNAVLGELKPLSPFGGVQNVPSEFNRVPPTPAQRNALQWVKTNSSANSLDVPKKSFNFMRIADNLSPRKNAAATPAVEPQKEVRHFNFDNILKPGGGESSSKSAEPVNASQSLSMPLHIDTPSIENEAPTTSSDAKKSKFLRPTSLPLKPGTFTPKRHHGITPNANTLPLISPETPRPSKSCVQLYLNGHAYTYLGLKCSTKMFYCTVNCPQPSYVAGMHKLSMYSVWQVCAENNPHPLGFKPKEVIALYDSRQKMITNTMAGSNNMPYTVVKSQQTVVTPYANNVDNFYHHQLKPIEAAASTETAAKFSPNEDTQRSKELATGNTAASTAAGTSSGNAQLLVGGYESHEDYTYIRGRGRGRYVCSECGIRCKKPSMLKKHIRTHTDVRPFTCNHCNFSFKTKGNLTKHMQSKTHYKKCIELGINPGPMPADGEFLEPDVEYDQQSMASASGRTSSMAGESDTDDYSDNETESSDTDESKSRMKEHEAARCLLSLSMTPPIPQSVSPQLPYHVTASNELATNVPIPAASPANSIGSSAGSSVTGTPHAIKRVVSFTSPKPPFDYHKQDKYYSNPEESKPKRNANITSQHDDTTAPIDLTKPRATAAVKTSTLPLVVPTVMVQAPDATTPTLTTSVVHSQAQIRDVIFGTGNNESGFLKTLISCSDKVRISAEHEELAKAENEDVLLQAYIKEQALQHAKMKQRQIARNYMPETSGMRSNTITTTSSAAMSYASNSSSNIMTTVSSISSAIVASSVTAMDTKAATTAAHEVASPSKPTKVEVPKIEIHEVKTPEVLPVAESIKQLTTATATSNTAAHSTTSVSVGVNSTTSTVTNSTAVREKPLLQSAKSTDESEESESQSDQETPASKSGSSLDKPTVTPVVSEPHNANLPVAVQQPDANDFSGVLSNSTTTTTTTAASASATSTTAARTVIVGEDGFKSTNNTNEIQPVYPRAPLASDGRPTCSICSKTFQRQHQLTLHMNIHYMERKFKCDACGISFRTQGHLQKHERSEAHKNKVMMTSTFGVPTTSNPRPFECTDCKIAFRIHGHLAKHLRSKTHVQKLECLQKLPFGTYAEIERAGISLTDIDTSDCENSLNSLKSLAQKLLDKDPSKLGNYARTTASPIPANTSGGLVGLANDAGNSNTGITSHDSASEDGFGGATRSVVATAIASLDNDSATNTPQRANSLSEDESIANGLMQNLKRRLPASSFSSSNGEESDNQAETCEKRARLSPKVNAVTVTATTATVAATITKVAATAVKTMSTDSTAAATTVNLTATTTTTTTTVAAATKTIVSQDTTAATTITKVTTANLTATTTAAAATTASTKTATPSKATSIATAATTTGN